MIEGDAALSTNPVNSDESAGNSGAATANMMSGMAISSHAVARAVAAGRRRCRPSPRQSMRRQVNRIMVAARGTIVGRSVWAPSCHRRPITGDTAKILVEWRLIHGSCRPLSKLATVSGSQPKVIQANTAALVKELGRKMPSIRPIVG